MRDADLSDLLRQWPFEPGRINARVIDGADGRPKVQIRLDLGVLQMEIDGRPDGAASLLDHHLARLAAYVEAGGPETAFVLTPDECRALREEGVQYYHRYVALFSTGDFARVARDAMRNLRMFDLCRDHAADEGDRAILEQFRPAVIAMRARAEAEVLVTEGDLRAAAGAIDRGIREIEAHLVEIGRSAEIDRLGDLALLRGMRDVLTPKLPASQRAELEERLRAALDNENYELAAILRDELRMMR